MNDPQDPTFAPHYLRVARALAFAALASGCTSAKTPAEDRAVDGGYVADVGVGHDVAVDSHEADTDVDPDLPFTSGPILPPELPANLA